MEPATTNCMAGGRCGLLLGAVRVGEAIGFAWRSEGSGPLSDRTSMTTACAQSAVLSREVAAYM